MSTDPHGQHNQPLPKPNDNPSSHDLLVADILNRKAYGLQKYGSLLQANNGRDTLLDAYEEILDLAVYLRTLMSERETIATAVKAERQRCIDALKKLAFTYAPGSINVRMLDGAIIVLEKDV